MNERARKAVGLATAYQSMQLDTLTSNAGPAARAIANGGDPDRSKLEWARNLLAQVIRQTGQDPDAPFTAEALQAAALLEEHDLATFGRYRRNLKQRHISITMLEAGLRRLKTHQRSAARVTAAATSAATRRGQGRELKLPEPQPWPTPVCGATLLDELSATIATYMVMAVEAVHTVALWVLFSYLLDAFETNPRLAITSPQKRCGKTTLLALLYQLTCRPLAAANLTPAVAFRVIEAVRPSLLIDETDTFLKNNDELRGVLNSGHTRATAFVIRCQSEAQLPRSFSTWAAIALAGIGQLPATLADRSIEIKLKRKTPKRKRHAPRSQRPRRIERTDLISFAVIRNDRISLSRKAT